MHHGVNEGTGVHYHAHSSVMSGEGVVDFEEGGRKNGSRRDTTAKYHVQDSVRDAI